MRTAFWIVFLFLNLNHLHPFIQISSLVHLHAYSTPTHTFLFNMVNLSYEDLNNQYHFRVADSSSRTAFDSIDGIQPLSITGKTFPAHSVSETTRGIPFPGLTIDNITSHIRVWVREPPTWQIQWRNSMLISASDKLMWAVWEAIRRLANFQVKKSKKPTTLLDLALNNSISSEFQSSSSKPRRYSLSE